MDHIEPQQRPLLMAGSLVKATLADRKTQTRRIVKENDRLKMLVLSESSDALGQCWMPGTAEVQVWNAANPDGEHLLLKCPFGRPDDFLYVRERARLFKIDDESYIAQSFPKRTQHIKLKYEADGAISDWMPYPERLAALHVGNCVSNGCYKEAARLWLKITNVRLEKLNDISEEDAQAEGIEYLGHNLWQSYSDKRFALSPKLSFMGLWQSIEGPGSWALNPWVWVIEFARVKP